MTLNQKIRTIQQINLIISLVFVCWAVLTQHWQYLLVSYLVFVLMCPLGISAGLHRLVSHRSYQTNPIWEYILTLFSVYATVGSSIAWVAVHRTHHAYSDKFNDPHSPSVSGKFAVWTGIGLPDTVIPVSFVKDLSRNKFHRFLHRHYFKILLIPVTILYLIDPLLGIVLYSLPATLSLQTTSVVNVLGHQHGYRNHDTSDKSTNSWVANIISLGEGWHNNHHKKSNAWNNREQWWEIDPIGLFISLIKR